jgi:adenylate cyclase
VDALLEGSVLCSGDRVRITAQLVRANPEQHVWAETYHRNLREVLALQSQVARAITNQIRIKLTRQQQVNLAATRPVNPDAHRLYLLGRFYLNKRTEEGFEKAIGFFQRSIEIDPAYASAYAGLADSYTLLSAWGFVAPKKGDSQSEGSRAEGAGNRRILGRSPYVTGGGL